MGIRYFFPVGVTMGAAVEVVQGDAGHRDVTCSRTFIGSHLGNGPKKGATRIIWNPLIGQSENGIPDRMLVDLYQGGLV